MVSYHKRKRGGQPKYVLDQEGNPITGLSQSKADGRYYITHAKPRKWLGADYHKALVRFREWQAKQKGATVTIREAVPEVMGYPIQPGTVHIQHEMPDDVFWAQVRSAITDNPHLAAQKTGLPLDRLEQFKSPDKTASLAEIKQLYLTKPNGGLAKSNRDAGSYWDEFSKIVGVTTIAEITIDHINRYHDKIYDDYKRKGMSPSWVKARFVAVKSILNYALKRGKDATRIQTVKGFCMMLAPPAKNASNPKDISPEHYKALLDKADTKWSAILLLALNQAGYPIDIASVKKTDIDLKKQTLVNRRTKTGVPRIAILWDRTIQAIEKYQAEYPHHSEFLFVSYNGGQYAANHIGRGFRRLRVVAGVPSKGDNKVEFSHIRDGAQTAAIEGGADAVRVDMLLGHKTGIRDDYLKRKPTMVKEVCEAIERHYFGGKK